MVAPVNDDRIVAPADSVPVEPTKAEVHEEEVEGCFGGGKNIDIAVTFAIRAANKEAEEAADKLRKVCTGKGLAPQTEIGRPEISTPPKGGVCAKVRVSATCVPMDPSQSSSTPQGGATKPANDFVPTSTTSPAPIVPPKPKEEAPLPEATRSKTDTIDKNTEWQKLKPSERAKAIRDAVIDRLDLSEDNADIITDYIILMVKQNRSYDEAVKMVHSRIDEFEKKTEGDLEETVIKPARKEVEEYNRGK